MRNQITVICNKESVTASVHPGLSLLDFLRTDLHLTGTKVGCREGDCGACTILIGELQGNSVKYQSINSCLFPIGDADCKHVVTIEGLQLPNLSIVQKSFVEEWASQCGFCTPGFIVSLTGYFLTNKKFNIDDAIESMDGNICRCTGHPSIIRAARKSAEFLSGRISNHTDHISALVKAGLLPEYFTEIPRKLKKIKTERMAESTKAPPQFYISGGTDLFVQKWEDILKDEVRLLSSNGISSIIKVDKGKCFLGARTSVSDFLNSKVTAQYLPSLKEKLKLFGSLPIRNRATIGGNIVNASPIGDVTNILLVLDAKLHLSSEREVMLKEFYKDYKILDLNNDELVNEISFDLPANNSFFNFEKVSQRTYLDIASVNSSIYLEVTDNKIIRANIAAGGVAPIPLMLQKASKFLVNKEVNYGSVSEAANIAQTEISPITDARGSAEYKSLLLRQLIFSHFIELFPDKISIKEIA